MTAQLSDGFESGDLTVWSGSEGMGGAQIPVVQSGVVFAGAHAMRATCDAIGQYRSEVHTWSNPACRWHEGDDLYYGWMVRLSDGFPSGKWQAIAQWPHHRDASDPWNAASPPLAIYVNSTNYGMGGSGICIGGGSNNPKNYPFWFASCGPAVEETWISLVIRVYWTTTPGAGHVWVWRDGELVVDFTPPLSPTLYPTLTQDQSTYFKMGYYRDAAIADAGSVFIDEVKLGADSLAPFALQTTLPLQTTHHHHRGRRGA